MAHTVDIIDGKTQNDVDFYDVLNKLADGNPIFPGVNDYKVTQSGTPGMSVVVTAGQALHYIGSRSSYFGSTLSTNTTLSVASNSSGSTRIDIVCVKFDTGVSSNVAGDNVVTLQYVLGTPGAGVPATPSNYTKIGEVSVANGAATIVNANITDRRVGINFQLGSGQFTQLPNGTPSNPPAGANKLYFKADGKPYMLDSSGVETALAVSTPASGFAAYLNGAQNVSNGADAKILIDTEDFDLGSEFDNATNHRFTATNAGYYLLGMNLTFQLANQKQMSAVIYKNGAEIKRSWAESAGSTNTSAQVTCYVHLAASDYIEFYARQDDATSRALITGNNNTFVFGQRLA